MLTTVGGLPGAGAKGSGLGDDCCSGTGEGLPELGGDGLGEGCCSGDGELSRLLGLGEPPLLPGLGLACMQSITGSASCVLRWSRCTARI
jgi:hypothetical protein